MQYFRTFRIYMESCSHDDEPIGKTLEYELVLANISGYGLQKVKFSITKE